MNKLSNFLKNNQIYLNFNKRRYDHILKSLKFKNKISVIFLVNHISQWKYQLLFEIFNNKDKFDVHVIFIPDENYNADYHNEYLLNKVQFSKKNINLISSYDEFTKSWKNLDFLFKPDIVFYSRTLLKSKFRYSIYNFKNSLNCYAPYSLFIDKNDKLQCGTLFHKLLWKQFLPFKENLKIVKNSYDAKNVLISDYIGCDYFKINSNSHIIWKNKFHKKIILAPHHTIEHDNKKNYFSTFLKLSKDFINLSIKYKNMIDFCFKPHPALKEKLYAHKDWGYHKTDDYYNFWNNGSNTILSEVDYHDLFVQSDALILDSVSFTAEYLYLNKPYCFLIKDNFDYNSSLNVIGQKIFKIIKKSNNINSIEKFINDNVFRINQSQLDHQKQILNELNILNKNNKLASETIYDFIYESIFN
ncbi:CDP-glycerol glycerophosphotransferase family protein [Candidatus Pelagibacter sp.]|uniref:CDP-glycerol glycerophosphotransferase family protein n=1 Tax=Candidatus Pelagibacter sp. TaxID=2024849 RepID=UPI003F878A6B